MLNLLPEEQKKKIIGEYTKRIWTVVFQGVIAVTIVSVIFLLPVYLMSHGIYSEASKTKADLDARIAESRKNSSEETIKDVYGTIALLDKFELGVEPGKLIESVVLNKPAGISLNHISYTPSVGNPPVIDIYGQASTRASLVAFSDRLKTNNNFSSVYIPISNFTKDKDITFTIKMIASSTPSR